MSFYNQIIKQAMIYNGALIATAVLLKNLAIIDWYYFTKTTILKEIQR
jgi:hypothetical protein